MEYLRQLDEAAALTDQMLRRIFDDQTEIPSRLKEAMEYMVLSPGKKIRSAMVLWCCRMVGGQITEESRIGAAAIEMVHTYSLIHDDLPAMDNDDMRRGRPSCHKQFDEATAILAGDGLLTLAFESLARYVRDAAVCARMIRTLAEAAGPAGMIAGQMADLQAEHTAGSMETLRSIHIRKTARMFAAAAAIGAIAGNANDTQLQSLLAYGIKLGLCFQIADDILDVSASSGQIGKTAGKDAAAGKLTYPALVGLDPSRQIARQLTDQALSALQSFGDQADILRYLANQLIERNK